MPPELLGPLGLTVALGLAVVALWHDHIRADGDTRAQRDRALAGWEAADAATARVAAALEQHNRDDETRRRRDER